MSVTKITHNKTGQIIIVQMIQVVKYTFYLNFWLLSVCNTSSRREGIFSVIAISFTQLHHFVGIGESIILRGAGSRISSTLKAFKVCLDK